MKKKSVSSIFVVLLVQIIIHGDNNVIIAQPPFNQLPLNPKQVRTGCGKTGDFENDTTVNVRNMMLHSLVDIVVRNRPYTGFVVVPDGPITSVQVLLLCPPHLREDDCSDCIEKSVNHVRNACPKNKRAVIWVFNSYFSYCMVRYADYDMRGKYEDWGRDWGFFQWDRGDANVAELNKGFSDLFNKLLDEAIGDNKKKLEDHHRNFAIGNSTYGSTSTKLYMSVQCTPDISREDCTKCLNEAKLRVEREGINKKKFNKNYTLLSMNCIIRYDHERIGLFPPLTRQK
ncbi:antimicrobial ginkbilobin-2-like protein [Rutidosis leptorrhynchoides]|uniref:antimicrobial ginkbilobin-2-like protein n=1 Tax=Rutidosis leptorrhynchoides TaxID=125765 RepID=UPI003A98F7D4